MTDMDIVDRLCSRDASRALAPEKPVRLKDKVAIVTGAATGIGQAIAIRFAREGAAVVVDYVGKVGAARKTEEAIANLGGWSIAIEADVSKSEDVERLIQGAVAKFGRLDIVVNDAGIEKKFRLGGVPGRHAEKHPCRQFDRSLSRLASRRPADDSTGAGRSADQHLVSARGSPHADERCLLRRQRGAPHVTVNTLFAGMKVTLVERNSTVVDAS
jgi:hypothetical protein